LAEPGRKPARLTFGWPEGAAVRLAPWEPGRRIVLIEGVEDGLAVLGACPEVTPWAVLGAGNAGSVRLPDGAKVTLCLDGDEAGRRAAVSTVKELWRRGHRVSVAKLPDGFDPLDVLRSGAR
jgi:DNA primase